MPGNHQESALANPCRIEDNHAWGNRYGFLVSSGTSKNFIVRNTARTNLGGNFSIGGTQDIAPIITNPGTTFIGATPWSNFSY
jgi:parallel beta-helix repeat protein